MFNFVNILGTSSKQPQIKKIGGIKHVVLTPDFLNILQGLSKEKTYLKVNVTYRIVSQNALTN